MTLRVAASAMLLISLTAVPAGARGSSDSLSQTRRELRAARARLYKARQSDQQLLATIATISGQLNRVQGRLASLRARLDGIEARIDATQRMVAKIDARREAYGAALGARARQLYIMGPASAEAWIGSQTFSDFVGRYTDMEFATRFDRASLEQLASLRHEELRMQKSLVAQRKDAIRARNQVADQASLVNDVLSTHQEAEDKLAARVAAYRSEVSALAAQERAIESLILSRSSVWTGAISRQGFAWPIRGQITSPYGPRWGGFHTGIDIDCTTGDPIGASKAGKVIAAEWGGGYGNMVIIDHGGGVTTLYAHNSRLLVHDGQYVSQHQKISLCGATGHATGDHLHFEVRVNGQHQNPMNFLP